MKGGPADLAAALVKDPVCGMTVNPATAKYAWNYENKAYYFCAASCLEKFKSDPKRYLERSGHSQTEIVLVNPSKPVDYVCPMCPEVHASKPGACPSCGMSLDRALPVPTRVEYTCPMHPQIVRPGPGFCPICGMALEPRTVIAEEAENPELVSMTRRFWASVA